MRDYKVERDIATLKERNARERALKADGWNVITRGSKAYGYNLAAWKGEEPTAVRTSYDLRRGGSTVTPIYKVGIGYELMDGTPCDSGGHAV
jgi:hypothetical protein